MENFYSDIRNSFKTYFGKNEHHIVPSSNLVPNDASLLFTNSGMVQFKDIFTGAEKASFKRATTVQKCIRAGGKHNDLENVGFTNRHHTFFEMLGNFSFGDYFKEEAIYFAWKFLTEELKLSKEKLYITVFHEDEEAFNIWKNLTGFADEKIIKIKTNDNFWSMGPTGPCGPCSEIFYDYGSKIQGGLPGSAEQDGARYTEIWNLVFMQYNQIDENTRIPLEKKGIDTGMGLERLISVLEDKTDNYDTSLFAELIHFSKDVIGKYSENNMAYRILADHARSTAFLIADGIHPSSEGRGYVLRRIIRRALRHLYMIGYKGGDFHKITGKVIELMGLDYPELEENRNLISSYARQEEEKFMSTLPTGMKFLENEIGVLSPEKSLEPKKAFMLYDTFGFPIDITNDILISNKLKPVSEEDFEKEMAIQKERSKQSWKGSGDAVQKPQLIEFASSFAKTTFEGYENLEGSATILGIFEDFIILNKTSFYPEGGGQIGDIGLISNIPVLDAIKLKDVILHKLASISGLKVGENVTYSVSKSARKSAQNAHSAHHLLHHFLRELFGETVVQKGSSVGRDKLRLDFSFNRSLTSEEIRKIENLINAEIAKGNEVKTEIAKIEDAKKQGAIAIFGEKYGEEVRVLKIGKSIELCGGTHVHSSSEICAFKIISEGAVASGIRRIEALTGENALNYMVYASSNLENLRSNFKLAKVNPIFLENPEISEDGAVSEVLNLVSQIQNLKSFNAKLQLNLATQKEGLLHKDCYIKCVSNLDSELTKQLINNLKAKAKAIIIFNEHEGKGTLTVFSSIPEIKANEIGKKIAEKFEGKGGGKTDFANFGGLNSLLNEGQIADLI